MFLTINELVKEKLRFLLITIVIVLVSYLAFFLTALAYGLATSYTQGINKWGAAGLILQADANNNIGRSILTEADYGPVVSDSTAPLGVGNATVEQDEADDVAIFGIETSSFLAPNVTEGRFIGADNEVVVSDELQALGISLNQEITFKGSDSTFKVVGFTDNATFQTAPIIYMQLPAWRTVASEVAGMTAMRDDTTVSAVVTKDQNDDLYNSGKLSWLTIRDYSFKLPGYNAQVLTFSLMIGFLIIIASFVLAIFMYVLTLQKKSIFGVLKAEGIPSGYIARSVMLQIVLLSIFGLLIGLVLTILSGVLLGNKVPFLINPLFFAGIFGLFLLFAAVGGIASVRSVAKIDPIEAIG